MQLLSQVKATRFTRLAQKLANKIKYWQALYAYKHSSAHMIVYWKYKI